VLTAHNGERAVSSIDGGWKNWIHTCKRMILDPYLALYIKINSKCIKDLNKRPKTSR
jgi:hypothetical protein